MRIFQNRILKFFYFTKSVLKKVFGFYLIGDCLRKKNKKIFFPSCKINTKLFYLWHTKEIHS